MTNLSPGANFNTEYQKANPGDVFDLAPGDYGKQIIKKRTDGKAMNPPVTFKGKSGVTAQSISLQGDGVTLDSISDLKCSIVGRSFTYTTPQLVDPADCVKDITLNNCILNGNGHSALGIHRAKNVKILGGSVFSPSLVDGDNQFTSAIDIEFGGVYFHDWQDVGPGQLHHIEALQSGGVDGLYLHDCLFEMNGTHDFFFRCWGTTYDGDIQTVKRIVVEHNTFRKLAVGGYYVHQMLDDLLLPAAGPSDALYQYNSFEMGAILKFRHGKIIFKNNSYPAMSQYIGDMLISNGSGALGGVDKAKSGNNVYKGGTPYFPGDKVDPNVDLHNAPAMSGSGTVPTPPAPSQPPIPPPVVVPPPPPPDPTDPCSQVKADLTQALADAAMATSQITALQAQIANAKADAKTAYDELIASTYYQTWLKNWKAEDGAIQAFINGSPLPVVKSHFGKALLLLAQHAK